MAVTVITNQKRKHRFPNGGRFTISDGSLAVTAPSGYILGIYSAGAWEHAYQDAEFQDDEGERTDEGERPRS